MLRVDSAKGGKTETHLDGIRGMAVLFIFIRHAWGLSGQSAMVVRIPGIGHYSLAPFVEVASLRWVRNDDKRVGGVGATHPSVVSTPKDDPEVFIRQLVAALQVCG